MRSRFSVILLLALCFATAAQVAARAEPESKRVLLLYGGRLEFPAIRAVDAGLREALAARPDDSRTHVNAGLVARFEGRDNDALASFNEAVRLDPTDQEARLNLGALLAAHGRREEAVVQFEEAVRLRPGDPRARRALEKWGQVSH
jgi:Flp pilus assembly protein TadD